MTGGTALFLQNRECVGAMIVHVPLLHALRSRPEGTPLVVYSPFLPGRVFESIGLADETCFWTRVKSPAQPHGIAQRTGLPALLGELRSRRYHRIVNLRPQSADITAAIAASGAAERIGYRTALTRLTYSFTTPRDTQIYRAINYLNLLGTQDHGALLVESMAALAGRASGLPSIPAGSFCFMPCGSERPKLWGEANFLALAQALAARDPAARFLLVLGQAERHYVELFERAGLGPRTSALVAASFPEIARAVLDARIVVANDCGPSHIAQIAGVPMVSIFGNWDGRARLRIAEWFHPRPGAHCVTCPPWAPLNTLGVDIVLAEVDRVLAAPCCSGGRVTTPPALALGA